MPMSKLAVALVALVSLTMTAPAFAASPITEAFLANVRPNVEFLQRSSRIAADRAATPQTRDYARGEADEITRTSVALEVFSVSDHRFAVAAATVGTDGVLTGRSAHVDVPVEPAGLGQSANTRMPMGADELATLRTLSGKSFDDFYWTAQVDALSQLRADYRQYMSAGDDSALRDLARRELPKVEHQLLLLSKI